MNTKQKKQFKIVVYGLKGGVGKSTVVNVLLDVLVFKLNKEVSVVELDTQESLGNAVAIGFSSRHKPVSEKQAKKPIVIYDTAGYKDINTIKYLEQADLILMPTYLCSKDYQGFIQGVLDEADAPLSSPSLRKKTWVIFNRVRKPHTRVYKKYKPLYIELIKSLKGEMRIAKTELSGVDPFAELSGKEESTFDGREGKKALKEALDLVNELPIITST